MKEAMVIKTGELMHRLFVTAVLEPYTTILNPVAMWNRIVKDFCDDLERRLRSTRSFPLDI
jgi:hypothetical protein